MKWIRTECGVVLDEENCFMSELGRDVYNKEILIKFYKNPNSERLISISNGVKSENMFCGMKRFDNEFFHYDSATVKIQGDNLSDVLEANDILVKRNGRPIPIWSIQNIQERLDDGYRIITHEQYMPLAQEVQDE